MSDIDGINRVLPRPGEFCFMPIIGWSRRLSWGWGSKSKRDGMIYTDLFKGYIRCDGWEGKRWEQSGVEVLIFHVKAACGTQERLTRAICALTFQTFCWLWRTWGGSNRYATSLSYDAHKKLCFFFITYNLICSKSVFKFTNICWIVFLAVINDTEYIDGEQAAAGTIGLIQRDRADRKAYIPQLFLHTNRAWIRT